MHGRMMCSPRAAGFAEWRIDRLERALNLTDAQRPKFEDYKTAASKAADAMRSACPADTPATGPARMDAMEKRMEAMLQAVEIRCARRSTRSTLRSPPNRRPRSTPAVTAIAAGATVRSRARLSHPAPLTGGVGACLDAFT